MKQLKVGTEDFKELIETNQYYVDKTLLIKDVLEEKVVLYTRPRRFGKTLNMSMLYYFFCNKENSKNLFEGLAVSKDEETMKHLNQYPVIYLSFKDIKLNSFEKNERLLKELIAEQIKKYSEIIDESVLDKDDIDILMELKSQKYVYANLTTGLKVISRCLEEYYHKKVIVLIDEYDVPLQNAYVNGFYDEMVDLMRGMLSSLLKTNSSLEKGVLTGCLRIARESIFTGLNNLKVRSIFDEKSSTYFGFTQKEVNQILIDYSLSDQSEVVKEWYDGYLFYNTEIYNPWSVLNFVNDNLISRKSAVSYWANSSGNDIVKEYIEKGDSNLREEFERLLNGESLEKTIKPELTYREMDDIDNIYSFLLFTGYLKVKEVIDEDRVTLLIPNKEVKRIYETIFKEWFNKQVKKNSIPFVEALLEEDVDKANEILNGILFDSISFYDSYESFYHGFMIGMLRKDGYNLQSNEEAGNGRFDLCVLPNGYKKKKALLIEFKYAKKEEDLERMCKEAINQIKQNKYIEGLNKKGYTILTGYGISFYKKSCWIEKV